MLGRPAVATVVVLAVKPGGIGAAVAANGADDAPGLYHHRTELKASDENAGNSDY